MSITPFPLIRDPTFLSGFRRINKAIWAFHHAAGCIEPGSVWECRCPIREYAILTTTQDEYLHCGCPVEFSNTYGDILMEDEEPTGLSGDVEALLLGAKHAQVNWRPRRREGTYTSASDFSFLLKAHQLYECIKYFKCNVLFEFVYSTPILTEIFMKTNQRLNLGSGNS